MHSCPICDAACYCGGDIDDSDVGDVDAQDDCTHCDPEEDEEGDNFDRWLGAT